MVMPMPFAMAGRYILSQKFMGFLSTSFFLFVSACICCPIRLRRTILKFSQIYSFLPLHPTIREEGWFEAYFFNNKTTAAVMIIFTKASGNNFFHPRFINWS